MLNNIIKTAFTCIGALTGFTLTRTVIIEGNWLPQGFNIALYVVITTACGIAFFTVGNMVIDQMLKSFEKLEHAVQKMTLYELTVSAGGLIAGLIVANLITIPVRELEIIGVPTCIIVNIFFGSIGIGIALGKKNEVIYESLKFGRNISKPDKNISKMMLLDTSVIIDGRIVDICRAGFMHGELTIPVFVLEELRRIADSSDSLKRNRGRRGLDILNILQKELDYPVKIENIINPESLEVDDKLIYAAKKLDARIVTIDYNLNKIASFQGVSVLNINDLANAVKPIALPGEEMTIQVVKDGKENGQGIGYLEDGTMIVVDGGRRHIGESLSVTVTSILQTSAGRMIFAKPKCSIEKVI